MIAAGVIQLILSVGSGILAGRSVRAVEGRYRIAFISIIAGAVAGLISSIIAFTSSPGAIGVGVWLTAFQAVSTIPLMVAIGMGFPYPQDGRTVMIVFLGLVVGLCVVYLVLTFVYNGYSLSDIVGPTPSPTPHVNATLVDEEQKLD